MNAFNPGSTQEKYKNTINSLSKSTELDQAHSRPSFLQLKPGGSGCVANRHSAARPGTPHHRWDKLNLKRGHVYVLVY